MRKALILTLFILTFNLFSQDYYSYIDIGNMGVEFNTSDLEKVDYFYLTLPTFYLREASYDIGISIQSSELRVPFYSTERFYFTLLESSLYWSPFNIDRKAILGPFIDLNILPNKNYWFSARTGLRFLWAKSSIDLFKDSKIDKEIILKTLDLELGYSFLENHFYVALSTDFTILIEGMNYINRDVIKEAFTP